MVHGIGSGPTEPLPTIYGGLLCPVGSLVSAMVTLSSVAVAFVNAPPELANVPAKLAAPPRMSLSDKRRIAVGRGGMYAASSRSPGLVNLRVLPKDATAIAGRVAV